jgi:hypothetical protein
MRISHANLGSGRQIQATQQPVRRREVRSSRGRVVRLAKAKYGLIIVNAGKQLHGCSPLQVRMNLLDRGPQLGVIRQPIVVGRELYARYTSNSQALHYVSQPNFRIQHPAERHR